MTRATKLLVGAGSSSGSFTGDGGATGTSGGGAPGYQLLIMVTGRELSVWVIEKSRPAFTPSRS
ncbi:hypothetical protein OG225_06965 [Nocardia sp. NBC_01377]|uniref:hypothetical protein n=1 Tax=Nocardia sp. NBC_01377 TaxID=2903595 RepID=UPI0032564598